MHTLAVTDTVINTRNTMKRNKSLRNRAMMYFVTGSLCLAAMNTMPMAFEDAMNAILDQLDVVINYIMYFIAGVGAIMFTYGIFNLISAKAVDNGQQEKTAAMWIIVGLFLVFAPLWGPAFAVTDIIRDFL